MSTKNLYYRHVIGKRLCFSDIPLSAFFTFSPIPYRSPEVFVRKNFGEKSLIKPARFFETGILLIILQQRLGTLLCVCSIFYSLSYLMAYRIGDDFLLDKIHEMLMNEELSMALLEGKIPNQDATNDLPFMTRMSPDQTFRKRCFP